MCGQEGYFGTSAFQVLLNIDKIMQLEADVWKEENTEAEIQKEFDEFKSIEGVCSINNLTIQSNVENIHSTDMGKENNYEL